MYAAALVLATIITLCVSLAVILLKWIIAQLGVLIVASLFLTMLLMLLLVMGDKKDEK